MSDNILHLVVSPIPRSAEDDLELRRLAIQIAAQMPNDSERALATLDYAKDIVRTFLRGGAMPGAD
jgi:hypothetical protein